MRQHQRGAALLLAVYFCCVTLFLVGILSLQRTNQAMRAAQLSRDLGQAFWLADAAIDSAVGRLREEALLDGIAYEALTPLGTATFTIHTEQAQLLPAADTTGLPRQRLTLRITGTGLTSGGRSSTAYAYVIEEGPAEGMWSHRLLALHGGRNVQDDFVSGNLRSGLGVLTSRLTGRETPRGQPAEGSRILSGLVVADDWDDLRARMSSAQSGLDRFYDVLQHKVAARDDDQVIYSDTGGTASPQDLDGEAFVGPVGELVPATLPPGIDPARCTETLVVGETGSSYQGFVVLPGGQRIPISLGGFLGPPPIRYHVTHLDKQFKRGIIEDLSPGAEELTLCVNAIVPPMPEGRTPADLLAIPPSISLAQPTTIYVTGSQAFDLSGVSLQNPYINNSFPVIGSQLPSLGITTTWDISATVSVVPTSLGFQIPGRPNQESPPLRIIVTQPVAPGQKPGTVLMAPNPQGPHVSIYAPQSLVGLLEPTGFWQGGADNTQGAINLESIVADEILAFVGSQNRIVVGPPSDGQSAQRRRPGVSATVVAWTHEPPPAAPGAPGDGNADEGQEVADGIDRARGGASAQLTPITPETLPSWLTQTPAPAPQRAPAPAPPPPPPPAPARQATPARSQRSGGGTVICTALHHRGLLPAHLYAADSAYARRYVEPPIRRAYQAWAVPVARLMQHSRIYLALARPATMGWAQHMAYLMGATDTDSRLGRWLHRLGVPLHKALARLAPRASR